MGVAATEAQAKVLNDMDLIGCQALIEQLRETKHVAPPRLEVLSRPHGQARVLLPGLFLSREALCPAKTRPFCQGLGDTSLHEGNNAGVDRVVPAVNAILASLLADQIDPRVDARRLACGRGDGAAVDHDVSVGVGSGNAVAELVGHPGHGLHAARIDLRILLGTLKTGDDLLLEALQLTRCHTTGAVAPPAHSLNGFLHPDIRDPTGLRPHCERGVRLRTVAALADGHEILAVVIRSRSGLRNDMIQLRGVVADCSPAVQAGRVLQCDGMMAHDIARTHMSLHTVRLLNVLDRALVYLVATVVRPVPFPRRTLAGEPIANMLHLNDFGLAPHIFNRGKIPGDDLESPID